MTRRKHALVIGGIGGLAESLIERLIDEREGWGVDFMSFSDECHERTRARIPPKGLDAVRFRCMVFDLQSRLRDDKNKLLRRVDEIGASCGLDAVIISGHHGEELYSHSSPLVALSGYCEYLSAVVNILRVSRDCVQRCGGTVLFVPECWMYKQSLSMNLEELAATSCEALNAAFSGSKARAFFIDTLAMPEEILERLGLSRQL